MKAIRYLDSCDHITVVNIGNKEQIISSAINIAIKRYKEDFRELCKQFYKESNKIPAIEAAIKDYKHAIRDYIDIRSALANPIIILNRNEARALAAKLF